MNGPRAFVEWMSANVGFNPRAGKYSDTLAELVVADLVAQSRLVAKRVADGTLRPETNADVTTSSATRNVDLVVWGTVAKGKPTPHIALENKLILAAHGKARKNRLGDIIAFSNHVHNAERMTVAAGLIGINISAEYTNPDPFAAGMTRPHFVMEKVVDDTVAIYARIPQRGALEDPYDRPEAFGVIVFRYDGEGAAEFVTDPPAPQPGHPLHYDGFIRRIAELYEQRRA